LNEDQRLAFYIEGYGYSFQLIVYSKGMLEMKGKVAIMMIPDHLTFGEYDFPEVEPGAVLVKVIRANICGSEVQMLKGLTPFKRVLGHEMVGEIMKLGPGVETDYAGNPVKVGDRIAAAYFLTCRKCNPCNEGRFHLCVNAYKHWTKTPEEAPHFHGAFGTHYYIYPDQYFYRVPDNVPDSAAASANCALSQVYFGLEKANLRYNETVVIQGAGGLGLYAAAVAKEFGATVIAIDALSGRLEKAKEFGADYLIDMNEYDTVEKRAQRVYELTEGKGADLGMELTGVPAALNEGIQLVRVGGRYVSIGSNSPGNMTTFDPGLMTRKSIDIIAMVRYDPWYLHKALKFLSRNIEKYPFGEMLDAEFCLEDLYVALTKSASREVTRASIVIS
jgi:threonine dehydrogenase-like Zn-dependent dehydrogenase